MAKQKFSHYRPHARIQESGEIINPHTGEATTPPSMTKQEFVRECDINNIVKSFSQTGMYNHVNARQGSYQDLPDHFDFQDAIGVIQQSEAAFMSLPSKVRDRFGQDPVRFLEFMSNPDNLEEMRTLGLAKPQEPVTPDPVAQEPKSEPPKA